MSSTSQLDGATTPSLPVEIWSIILEKAFPSDPHTQELSYHPESYLSAENFPALSSVASPKALVSSQRRINLCNARRIWKNVGLVSKRWREAVKLYAATFELVSIGDEDDWEEEVAPEMAYQQIVASEPLQLEYHSTTGTSEPMKEKDTLQGPSSCSGSLRKAHQTAVDDAQNHPQDLLQHILFPSPSNTMTHTDPHNDAPSARNLQDPPLSATKPHTDSQDAISAVRSPCWSLIHFLQNDRRAFDLVAAAFPRAKFAIQVNQPGQVFMLLNARFDQARRITELVLRFDQDGFPGHSALERLVFNDILLRKNGFTSSSISFESWTALRTVIINWGKDHDFRAKFLLDILLQRSLFEHNRLRSFTVITHDSDFAPTCFFRPSILDIPAALDSLQLLHIEGDSSTLADRFPHFPALQALVLTQNRYLVQLPPAVQYSTRLKILDLTYSRCSHFVPAWVADLPELRLLRIGPLRDDVINDTLIQLLLTMEQKKMAQATVSLCHLFVILYDLDNASPSTFVKSLMELTNRLTITLNFAVEFH